MSSTTPESGITRNNVGDGNSESERLGEVGKGRRVEGTDMTARFVKALRNLQTIAAQGQRGAAELLSQCKEIKHLINQGVNVNAPSPVPALMIAIEAWRRTGENHQAKSLGYCHDIIRDLLNHGVDVNVHNEHGRTPLILAIENTSSDLYSSLLTLVDELLEAGAYLDPPAQSNCAWPTSPLIAAISHHQSSTVKLLLSKKANVNTRMGDKTGLYVAVHYHIQDLFPNRVSTIVSTLLEHGADVKGDEKRILTSAISRCPESVERFLYECYGSPQAELRSNEGQAEFSKQDPQESQAAPSTLAHLSPLEDGYHAVSEKSGKLNRLLVETGEYARNTVLRLTESISKNEVNEERVDELCSSCRAFEQGVINREWITHSSNSQSIQLSVLGGCAMCQLIKDCLPECFGEVSLYYYSALSDSDTLSKNYYERIIVRGQDATGTDEFAYGELRLAKVDDATASALARIIGYDDRATDSEASFALVAHWMATCLNHHGNFCHFSREKFPRLPTRVIDVGPSDGSEAPLLFITEGRHGAYITLSYCWGDTVNLRTESRTLEEFRRAVSLELMPKTIQEAIMTTRRLGIRYLWVDALCIIQDSLDDWLCEAKNIANIYRNSILTIAAADLVDSEGGLFRKRQRSRTRPVQFLPRIAPLLEMGPSKYLFVFGDRQESNDALRRESRLDGRGWVLQEQLLSIRTLNYSSQELYWECPALQASESYPAGIPPGYDRNFERRYFTELKMKISGNNPSLDKERVHMLWQHLVVLYSRRELSRQTDKLVALSGAAHQVSRVLDDIFLAGLWVKWLWRDLLWWVEENIVISVPPSVNEFKAPSWSWASVKGHISYNFPHGTGPLRYYPCIQVLGYGEKLHIESNGVSGFITVRGVILEATIPDQPSHLPRAPGKPGPGRAVTQLKTIWRESQNGPGASPLWKPDTEGIASESIQCLIVAASHQYIVSLGLVSTGRKPDEYRRVGLAHWSQHDCLIPDEVQFQVITIV